MIQMATQIGNLRRPLHLNAGNHKIGISRWRLKKISAKTRAPVLCGTKEGKLQPEVVMLWTIFVILLVLWLLGLVSSYTMGGFIHILLVLAIIVLIINLVSGRRGV
jgi:hypothetical protein